MSRSGAITFATGIAISALFALRHRNLAAQLAPSRADRSRGGKSRVKTAVIEPAVVPLERSLTMADFAELVKARLTFLVLLTTAVGFYLGWQGPMNFLALMHAVLGTAFAAAGAAALNQWWEHKFDAIMHRTRCGRFRRAGCAARRTRSSAPCSASAASFTSPAQLILERVSRRGHDRHLSFCLHAR